MIHGETAAGHIPYESSRLNRLLMVTFPIANGKCLNSARYTHNGSTWNDMAQIRVNVRKAAYLAALDVPKS